MLSFPTIEVRCILFAILCISFVNCFYLKTAHRSSKCQHCLSRRLNGRRQSPVMVLNKNIFPQPTWGLIERKTKASVADVISVIGRFEKREDFYKGSGYKRPAEGLLTKESFYDAIKGKKFKKWPMDKNGKLFGESLMPKEDFEKMYKEVVSAPPPLAGADAVFTSFAKGAENGLAYPRQVDEEMSKWLTADRQFDLNSFQLSLLLGRLYVFIGWFLYIGLQFGGVYVVFFVPIVSQFFPEVDFYPIQTFLHTSEWGK